MPNEDPYAKYLTPPQGSSPAAAPASAGDDPYAKYLTPPSAAPGAAAPAATDYSKSPWSAAARTLAESASLGAGDLIYSHMAGTSLAGEQAKTEAAKASLPWYERYPLEAGGYMLGAGALLSGVPEALGVGGVAGMALEGGLAGGASAALHSDDPSLSDIGRGAAGGALLGGAAGGAGKLVSKALSKPGVVDPEAAIAQTGAAKTAAYDALHQAPIAPGSVDGAVKNAERTFTDSEWTGMSPGLKAKVDDIIGAVRDPNASPTAGDVDSWQRQIREAATTPVDQAIAGRLGANFDAVIKYHGAEGLQADAKAAFQQHANANDLRDWAQNLRDFGQGPGAGPQGVAQKFYKPGSPEYEALSKISSATDPSYDPSYAVSHIGGAIGSGAGAAIAGFPGMVVGHPLGQAFTKWATKNLVNKMKQRGVQRSFQEAYPTLTGIQPTGAVQGLNPGEAIKNLMMGGAY